MVCFVHSADWQLGARFAQFAGTGNRLREARLETLRRTLDFAREREVDALLIAGDLFEDNRVPRVPKTLTGCERLVSAVPWGHYANVLTRVSDPAALLYYLQATARFG